MASISNTAISVDSSDIQVDVRQVKNDEMSSWHLTTFDTVILPQQSGTTWKELVRMLKEEEESHEHRG